MDVFYWGGDCSSLRRFNHCKKLLDFSVFNRSENHCNCSKYAFQGVVEDCCCDYQAVNGLNGEVLNPMLQELVKTPFFRCFKVKLCCDSSFWPGHGMSSKRDCSVSKCLEDEFPEQFREHFTREISSEDLVCEEEKPEAAVDQTIDTKAFRGWMEVDNLLIYDDETDDAGMSYVNLQLNPEKYTGYTSSSARKVWRLSTPKTVLNNTVQMHLGSLVQREEYCTN